MCVEFKHKEDTTYEWPTIIVSKADSAKCNLQTSEQPTTISVNRIPFVIHEFNNKVEKFNSSKIIVQYINCLQQPDSDSRGLYATMNAHALQKHVNLIPGMFRRDINSRSSKKGIKLKVLSMFERLFNNIRDPKCIVY